MSYPQDNGRGYMEYGQSIGNSLGNEVPTRPTLWHTSSSHSINDGQGQGQGGSNNQRSVVRAACLNCRSAKRRCDGVTPVCGPCTSRGIEAGGCNFVSSKRGGPRYKGVKGSEAAKVKADKEKAREAARMTRGKRGDHERSKSSQHPSDAGSTASQQSNSPPHHGAENRTSTGSGWRQGSTSSKHSLEEASNHSRSAYSPFGPASSLPRPSSGSTQVQYYNGNPPNMPGQQDLSQNYYQQGQLPDVQGLPIQSFSLEDETSGLPINDVFGSSLGGPLSFANLELWQRIQEGATDQDLNAFSDFYSRLEMLPKAGTAAMNDNGGLLDPLDVLMDWEGGETGNNVQDNEQGARTLLSDYYDFVYPSCPVLLPPGNLPSLAFYFSGKGPCGLFAAISSIVSLHLPPHEAVKTLKNSQAAMARLGGGNHKFDDNHKSDEAMTTAEIAAYHAKTSELILHQYEETKATCFIDTTCPNPFDGMDEELITIEAAAAHTLLCHYYYGSNQPLGHQRAYKHAVEAWNLVQKLDLLEKLEEIQSSSTEVHHPNAARPFSSELKLEWAKRVYWASYAAATVMSCTGGFVPFGNPKDEVMDLKLRPHLEHDVAAWGVMVRGAQQVSRTYRLLYNLDHLRAKLLSEGNNMSQNDLHQAAIERQTIFNAMLKLDTEIGTYTRFDPSWRNMSAVEANSNLQTGHVEGAEVQLAKSLKVAGRLMTSGAIIILHRAQAFSNARVFMKPQCGIPEAIRVHKPVAHDVILHRANTEEGGNGGGGGDLERRYANGLNVVSRLPPMTLPATTSVNPTYPNSTQQMAQAHPFLTDRFAGGPFEPTHALERCRFAASTMITTLPNLLGHGTPKLPPYSACSFVLGAYATLMLTLLIQIHGEEIEQRSNRDGNAFGGDPRMIRGKSDSGSEKQEELKKQLAMHRAPVKDIIIVLNQFANTWAKALEYREEVSTLLAANEIIG